MASMSKKRKLALKPYITLNQEYLMELAEKIPSHYHQLLIYLGVEEHTIDRIEQDNKYVSERAFKGLIEWRGQFEGPRDERKMIQCLKKALANVKRNDLNQTLGNKRRKAQKEKSHRDKDLEAENVDEDEGEQEQEEEQEEEDEEEVEEEEKEEDNNDDNDSENDEGDTNDDNDDDDDDDYDDDDDEDDDNNDDEDDEYFPVDKCIVAGVKRNDTGSSLSEISPSKFIVKSSILLKVESKAALVTYRKKKMLKYRQDLILSDGVTFIKGVAFEHSAQTIKDKLSVGKVYEISRYKVKQANVVPSHMELHLFDKSKISLKDNKSNQIKDIQVMEFTINDVKELKPINQLVYLNKAVIIAVSEIKKKKRKYLRTVLLKDHTEKVMLEIWYEEEETKVKFEYKSGDIVKATFVKVGAFGDEIHLTLVSTTELVKQEDKRMAKKLLKGETLDIFTNRTMSIKEIKELKNSHDTITVQGVQLVSFRKEQESDLVYDTCSIVPSHGKLIAKADKLYCKTCVKFVSGQKMVQLNAEVVDDSAESEWVAIFNQCSKVILGGLYANFIKCSHFERVQILKNLEDDETLYYVFEVNVKKGKFTSITATSITKIE